MGLFGRRRDPDAVGYQDNQALDGVGGYQPADYGGTARPTPSEPTPTPNTPSTPVTEDDGPHDRTVSLTTVRRPRPRRWGAITVIIWVVVIAAILVAQYAVSSRGVATSRQPTAGPTPTTPPSTRQSAPAVVPGWQAVVDAGGAIAYDVPADWHVSYLGDGIQLHDGGWRFTMTMVASYLDGYCEQVTGSNRAMAGAGTVPQANGSTAAEDTARHVANFAYGPAGSGEGAPPTVTVGTPRQVKADGATGDLVTARVTVNHPGSCGPASALVDVFALPNPAKHESLVVVGFADQQFVGAVSQHDLDTIVTSIRQLSAH